MYMRTGSLSVVRLSDNAIIPPDIDNQDWQAYQSWLAAGNEIAPAPTISEEEALEQWRQSARVSARQGMEQLIRTGLDEQVDAKIEAIEEPLQRKLTRNWVDKAEYWERSNAQFIALGEALELTPEQMDEHIRAASKL